MNAETEHEKAGRHLEELLQETRVIMPGVQVLFAFLLAVAFQQNFDKTSDFQRHVFLATILCDTAAIVCFISPAAWNRVLFGRKDKRHIVKIANWFVISGLVFLALAMTLALVLVCDVVFSDTTATVVPAIVFLACGWCWFLAPLLRRRRDRIDHVE